MQDCIEPTATIARDELRAYPPALRGFAAHETVCHSREEYVNADGFHTNTAEWWFALFKCGVVGTFHHIGKKHVAGTATSFRCGWGKRLVNGL
jgi:hypothetical protein